MSIVIEKRTRALVTDAWGVWAETTDAAPYVNTDLVEYRVQANTYIDISQFTDGEVTTVGDEYIWEGNGVFDIMMKAINGNVKVEYDSGRITSTEYATVYLGALQTAIPAAIQFLLQEQDAEAKTDVAKEQAELLRKQQLLVERQTKGFDDDAKQKLLKQALDSWSVAYSVAQDANSIPDTIKVNVIDSIMKNAYTSLGIVKTNDPIGEV
jgi:hypothetical protein